MMIRGYEIAGRTLALVIGLIVLVAVVIYVPSCIQKQRSERAQSRTDAAQAEAASNSAADAINTVSEAGKRETASEDLTRENERDIRAAEGAGDRVNSASDLAGRRALCRRAAYENDPKCKVFRQ